VVPDLLAAVTAVVPDLLAAVTAVVPDLLAAVTAVAQDLLAAALAAGHHPVLATGGNNLIHNCLEYLNQSG
jgi:hypothetical protein